MPIERHPALFTEFIQNPLDVTPIRNSEPEPRKVTASSLVKLRSEERDKIFDHDGPIHIEVDIPVVARKSWRLGKNRVGIYNNSVNPLSILLYQKELWNLSMDFGIQEEKIPIPVGSVIEAVPRKTPPPYRKELELVRVLPPSRV